jgi:hypothetical protein
MTVSKRAYFVSTFSIPDAIIGLWVRGPEVVREAECVSPSVHHTVPSSKLPSRFRLKLLFGFCAKNIWISFAIVYDTVSRFNRNEGGACYVSWRASEQLVCICNKLISRSMCDVRQSKRAHFDRIIVKNCHTCCVSCKFVLAMLFVVV